MPTRANQALSDADEDVLYYRNKHQKCIRSHLVCEYLFLCKQTETNQLERFALLILEAKHPSFIMHNLTNNLSVYMIKETFQVFGLSFKMISWKHLKPWCCHNLTKLIFPVFSSHVQHMITVIIFGENKHSTPHN